MLPNDELPHPKVRADCLGGQRPCLRLNCRYHLLIDHLPQLYHRTGVDARRFPGLTQPETRSRQNVNPDDTDAVVEYLFAMKHTCTLDLVQPGGLTLEEVGQIFAVTRERIRQVEFKAVHRRRVWTMFVRTLGVDFLEELVDREKLAAGPPPEHPVKAIEPKPKRKPRPARIAD